MIQFKLVHFSDPSTGKVWLLITTDVASRGLDLPSTSTVINYDCPASVTDYVHRVGRCGRYNRKGKALTLMTDKDQDRIRILRGVMTQAGFHGQTNVRTSRHQVDIKPNLNGQFQRTERTRTVQFDQWLSFFI